MARNSSTAGDAADEGTSPSRRAWAVLRLLGRVMARTVTVFFGVLGAIGGRSNAVLPPDMPPDRREDYRP